MSRLGARAERAVPLADAVRRLGPGWLAFRLRYKAELASGAVARRSPVMSWPPLTAPVNRPQVADRQALQTHLQGRASELNESLTAIVADLRRRRFDVFGTAVEPASWHEDGLGCTYPNDVHWSRIGETGGCDLKLVWEPSRFGWAYDLARAELVNPELGAGALFWELFDGWCSANRPNAGVNWSCGQESSLRLMAVTLAASVIGATDEQASRLQRFAWQTGERVLSNIDYARSQQNNHAASEAVGLLTAALLHPGHERGPRWFEAGERVLAEVCNELVFADGGTSQYSANYHRVFLHNLVWAVVAYRRAGHRPPDWLTGALDRSTTVLAALAHPVTGRAPYFGADDGARILPLAFGTDHTDVAPDVALARAVLADKPATSTGTGPVDEPAAWFGHSPAPVAAGPVEPVQSFPEFGVHVVSVGTIRLVLRCGSTTFRPSHDDQLHFDLWVGDRHVLRDARTVSYHPKSGDPGSRREAEFHNGPRLAGRPAMRQASRFLWSHWPTASLVVAESGTDRVRLTASLELVSGLKLERTITVEPDGLVVADRASEPGVLETNWLLGDGVEVPSTGLVWRPSVSEAVEHRQVGAGYRRAVDGEFRVHRSPADDPRLELQILVG